MIINDSIRLNEVRSINLDSGATAYQYGDKYYIKKGDEKKEISSDQYNKLISKDVGSQDKSKLDSKSKFSSKTSKKDLSKSLGINVSDNTVNILNKYNISNSIDSVESKYDKGWSSYHLVIHMKDGSIMKPYDGYGSSSSGLSPNEMANGIASALIGEDRGVAFMKRAREKRSTQAYQEASDPEWVKEVDDLNKKADAFDEIRKALVKDIQNQN